MRVFKGSAGWIMSSHYDENTYSFRAHLRLKLSEITERRSVVRTGPSSILWGQARGCLVVHRWPHCNDGCISCCPCCCCCCCLFSYPPIFSNLCTILFYSSFVFYEQRTREKWSHRSRSQGAYQMMSCRRRAAAMPIYAIYHGENETMTCKAM